MTLYQRAAQKIDRALIQSLYPGGKWKGTEYWVNSPLRDDRNPDSFSINIMGLWKDFATNESGNLYQLIRQTHGLKSDQEAAQWILGERQEKDDTPMPLIENHKPKQEKPEWAPWDGSKLPRDAENAELVTRYMDGDNLVFLVIRQKGKIIRPWYYTPRGWVQGIPPQYNDKRPLYGTPDNRPVIIVEGEKAADALQPHAPGYWVTTWHGGAQNVEKADWGRLDGKVVYLWPDKDKPGIEAMERLYKVLGENNDVRMLDVDKALPNHEQGTDAADLMHDDIVSILGNKELWTKKKLSTFGFTRMDQIDMSPPDWLIRDIMDKGTSALLFGDSGSGKSFVAVDMACCVASNRAYHGHQVKGGQVVYIAGEGRKNIRKRFEAWERQHKTRAMDKIFLSNSGADLFADSKDILLGLKDSGIKPVLIIVDTLARNMGSGDENEAQTIGNFVNGVEALAQGTGASILVVHHTGHQNKERARGSSALRAAMDWEYRLSDVQGTRQLDCTKSKDYDFFKPIAFDLQEYEFEVNGHTLTSAVLVTTEVLSDVEKSQTESERTLLKCIELEGKNACDIKSVRDRFVGCGFTDRTYRRIVPKMIQKGSIVVTGTSISLKYQDVNNV